MIAPLVAALLTHTDLTGATAAPDPLGRGAWLIDATEDAVLLVTPRAGVERFDGCRWPSQLVVDARGVAYVTCRETGDVMRLAPNAPPLTWPAGAEPAALALDARTRRLYVGLATANEVLMMNADTGRIEARAHVRTEPTAIGLFGGGV